MSRNCYSRAFHLTLTLLVLLIQKHELKFPPEVFEHVSTPCKGLVRLLLEPDPQMRMGIDEALRHPWLQTDADSGGLSARELANLAKALPLGCRERREATAARRAAARLKLQETVHRLNAIHKLTGTNSRPSTARESSEPKEFDPAFI